MKTIKIKATFLEEILGTAPTNEDIYRDFIASKSADALKIEEEVAAIGVEEVVEKGMTIFPRNASGKPIFWDYQIKGFFKDACGMLARVSGTASNKLKAYKKIIDGLVFVSPRQIEITTAEEIGKCERPLRAQTAQGERIALAISESIKAGATIEFEVTVLSDDHEKAVIEWLQYGILRGLGQWRNSGKGRFTYKIIE